MVQGTMRRVGPLKGTLRASPASQHVQIVASQQGLAPAGRLEELASLRELRAGGGGRGRGKERGGLEAVVPLIAHRGAAQSHGAASQRSGLGAGGAVVVRRVEEGSDQAGLHLPFSPAEVPGVRLGKGLGIPGWAGPGRCKGTIEGVGRGRSGESRGRKRRGPGFGELRSSEARVITGRSQPERVAGSASSDSRGCRTQGVASG